VDESGDWRGAFHGVRQPDVQRELGGFADCAKEDAEGGGGGETSAVSGCTESQRLPRFEGRGQIVEVDVAAIGSKEQQNADHEAEVANAVGEEGFFAGFSGAGLLVPVTDEQVGAQTDKLPENEHHDQVSCQHDAGHGKHEEGECAEEARLGIVILHVAQREDVHQHADEADDEHHAPALLVDQDINVRMKIAGIDEWQEELQG
jgi:hypothetical protein